MNKTEQLKRASARQDAAENALSGFVSFHLPERIRARFASDEGREVFMHSVVFGNRVYPHSLLPQDENEAEAIALEDTYRMIEREMTRDVREECRELGLVD